MCPEILGPNYEITKEEAMADRLLHSEKYTGRGIVIWEGTYTDTTVNCSFFGKVITEVKVDLYRE